MTCQEARGYKLYVHPATNSVNCTFPSAEPETDVACVCGSCGSKRGIRQWFPLEVQAVQSWPTMALKSRSKFKSYAAWRKDLKGKGKGKGKSDLGPVHGPLDSNPSSVLMVRASEAEDSAAPFQGTSDVSNHKRVQPMRQAKLLRIPIVDSDIEHQLVFSKGSSSSSSNSSKAAAGATSVIVKVVAVPRMMILSMMMGTCLAVLTLVPQSQIVHHHLMRALNLNRNPRSIGVRLYIVRGSGCWMWTPCQVMVVPCICSVKGSTAFTVRIKEKYSFLFCMLLC